MTYGKKLLIAVDQLLNALPAAGRMKPCPPAAGGGARTGCGTGPAAS